MQYDPIGPILPDEAYEEGFESDISPESLKYVKLWSKVKIQEDGYPEDTVVIIPESERDRYTEIKFVSEKSALGEALLQRKVGDEVYIDCDEPYAVEILSIEDFDREL